MNIEEIKNQHKLLKEWKYDITPIDRGYSDKTLYINISDNTIKSKDVPQEMKEKFIGGKGYGLKYYGMPQNPTPNGMILKTKL